MSETLKQSRYWLTATCFCTLFSGQTLQAESQIEEKGKPLPLTQQVIQTAEGIFQLNDVTINLNKREVSFPAQVELTSDPLEYAIVTHYGNAHETLLTTQTSPTHIHFAMLLLGIESTQSEKEQLLSNPNSPPQAKKGPNHDLISEAKAIKTGAPVSILITWQEGENKQTQPLEYFIHTALTDSTLSVGTWNYSGSSFRDGRFRAQTEGNIVTLIADRDSLINNPREGNDNDEIWSVHKAHALPRRTAVTVTFQLTQTNESTAKPKDIDN